MVADMFRARVEQELEEFFFEAEFFWVIFVAQRWAPTSYK